MGDAELRPCPPSVRGSMSTGFHLPCSLPWSAEQGKPGVVWLWGSDLGVKDKPAPLTTELKLVLFSHLLAAVELIGSPFVGFPCLSLSWLSGDREERLLLMCLIL